MTTLSQEANVTETKEETIVYPVSSIAINICASLYQEWSSSKSLYKDIPEEGIPVTIEYADTLNTHDSQGNEIKVDSPTVLMLHGAPGSHNDFKHLIKDLQETGHRVIAPNFPSEYLFVFFSRTLQVMLVSRLFSLLLITLYHVLSLFLHWQRIR